MTEEFTTADLLDELAKYVDRIQERRPGGVTTREYAAEFNVSKKTAGRVLAELFEDGILIRERVRVNRHGVGYVYYKA